ncbi:MAG: hypothetical protein L6R42_002562 [Xanthoria sp. 1 TBL-2021]|nr:MAG: hypothetical protein L6R42_002562 [Xanthoria sp. 1 TBL-2021]
MKTSTKSTNQFDYRQPWLKRVLVPFWVFQSLFMIAVIGLNAWVQAYRNATAPDLVLIFACVNLALIIGEILFFVRRRLKPLDYLVNQVIKTALWVTLFGMSIAGIVANKGLRSDDLYLFIGIIQVIVVLLSFIGTLIYASVIYHRHRRGTPYHRSSPKSSTTPSSNEYTGPFGDPELGTANYSDRTSKTLHHRDSTAAPEIDEGGKKRMV